MYSNIILDTAIYQSITDHVFDQTYLKKCRWKSTFCTFKIRSLFDFRFRSSVSAVDFDKGGREYTHSRMEK